MGRWWSGPVLTLALAWALAGLGAWSRAEDVPLAISYEQNLAASKASDIIARSSSIMKGLRIAACFSFVSLSLLMIALTSDYWIVASDGRANAGLWQECEDALCVSYGMDVPGYIQVTRDFLLLGMVAGTVSFFGFCASFFHTHIGSFSTKRLAVWACFAAGVCSMIAVFAYTGVYNDQIVVYGTWFGWSFGIGWASFILFLITGGLAYKTVGGTA